MNQSYWMSTPDGYRGTVSYSGVDRCYHGHILGLRDYITYESDSFSGCRDAMCMRMDEYKDYIYQVGAVLQLPQCGVSHTCGPLRPQPHRRGHTVGLTRPQFNT